MTFFAGLLGVLMTLQLTARGQGDTLSPGYVGEYVRNLGKLREQWTWFDTAFVVNDFSRAEGIDFEDGYKKLQTGVFPEPSPEALLFYDFLNKLPQNDKQNLLLAFSLHEKFIENALQEAGLPSGLKYLPPAMSAMNMYAAGQSGRAGVWQLTHFQGVLNGLRVTRLVDERLNIDRSTTAAVSQLKKNREIFGSATMAVLAYLAGNAKTRNTLDRMGGETNIDRILELLPVPVSEQVAAFQAMTVFLSENSLHHVEYPKTDTVLVDQRLHLQQVADVLHVPIGRLVALNPQYRHSIVPGKGGDILLIPGGMKDEFWARKDSVFAGHDPSLFAIVEQRIEYPPTPNRQYLGEKVKDLEIEGKTKIRYTIRSGDVLGIIAEKFDVRVADLKYWNNIYNERRIQVGQKLDIFVDEERADRYGDLIRDGKETSAGAAKSPAAVVPKNARRVEHVVKSGESPYVIAKKYDGVTPEKILEWNNISDARKIQIGQKLILYLH